MFRICVWLLLSCRDVLTWLYFRFHWQAAQKQNDASHAEKACVSMQLQQGWSASCLCYHSIYSLPSLPPHKWWVKVLCISISFGFIYIDAWQVATAMLQYGYGKQLPEKAKGLRFCRLREHCHSWCWLKRSRKCHGKPCSYSILPGKVKKPDFNAYLVICTQPWQRIYKQSMWKTLPYKWLHVPCKTIGDPLILRTFLGEPQILTAPYFVYLDLHPSSNSIVEMKRGQFQYTVSFSSFVLFGSCNYLQCMKSWKEYCERCLVRRESGICELIQRW